MASGLFTTSPRQIASSTSQPFIDALPAVSIPEKRESGTPCASLSLSASSLSLTSARVTMTALHLFTTTSRSASLTLGVEGCAGVADWPPPQIFVSISDFLYLVICMCTAAGFRESGEVSKAWQYVE